MAKAEPIAPNPAVTSTVEFKLDQSVIVDAHITKLVSPLRAQVAQLRQKKNELDASVYQLNEDLGEALKGLREAGIERLQPLMKVLETYIPEDKRLVPHASPYLDEQQNEKLEIVTKAKIEISLRAVPKNFNPDEEYSGDYDALISLIVDAPANDKVKTASDALSQTRADQRATNYEIKRLDAEINTIVGRRAEFLAAINAQLLAQSEHGAALLAVLDSVGQVPQLPEN